MNVAIRDWTFTHWWVRHVVKIWFGIYHKSVSYSGTENIDWQKPIIFAPSHQNAFSDALCLILSTKYTGERFIYPLIRADAFGNNKATDWILTAFHMMPVYRPRDKVNVQKQNQSVFDSCCDILAKKRNLLIHPEGNCIPKKRVRPFKKGLARIAFSAEQAHDFNLGVTVIPVGINYRQITEPRKGIHIQYGQPVSVADFKDTYKNHAATGITQLTRAVQKGVENLTVDIKSDNCYSLSEDFFELNKNLNQSIIEKTEYSKEELESNRKIVQTLQDAGRNNAGFIETMDQKLRLLKKVLQLCKLNMSSSLIGRSLPDLIMEGLLYLVLLPVILYGWVNNIIPWLLSHKLADKIKELQFKSSLRMLVGLLLFPLSYLIQTTAVFMLSGSWMWSLLYILSIPIAGLLALNCWENYRHWQQKIRLFLLPDSVKQRIGNLTAEIFSFIR